MQAKNRPEGLFAQGARKRTYGAVYIYSVS